MSDQLPLGFETEFDARVMAVFQEQQVLMGSCFEKFGVVGKYVQFRRRGKGVATPHVRNSPITPLNLGLTVATAEMTDWDAAERLDPNDLAKINWDDMSVVAESLGMALGRRADQIKIDAMEAASPTQIAVDYGGSNSAINVEKINRANALLTKNGVPAGPGMRQAVISAVSLEGALNDTKIGSVDYNVYKSLFEGNMKEYSGFTFHIIGDRAEGGLPTDGSGYRKCYFFHKDALGYGEAFDQKVRKDYSADYQGWVFCGKLSAGSKVIESDGILEVLSDESTAAS